MGAESLFGAIHWAPMLCMCLRYAHISVKMGSELCLGGIDRLRGSSPNFARVPLPLPPVARY